jgi:hypothetical protein
MFCKLFILTTQRDTERRGAADQLKELPIRQPGLI